MGNRSGVDIVQLKAVRAGAVGQSRVCRVVLPAELGENGGAAAVALLAVIRVMIRPISVRVAKSCKPKNSKDTLFVASTLRRSLSY
jgi:hypothetical protein